MSISLELTPLEIQSNGDSFLKAFYINYKKTGTQMQAALDIENVKKLNE